MLYQGAEVTRSLSNLIKYPFVNMQGKETVVIDNNSEGAEFVPFREKGVKIKTISEIEAEKALLAVLPERQLPRLKTRKRRIVPGNLKRG